MKSTAVEELEIEESVTEETVEQTESPSDKNNHTVTMVKLTDIVIDERKRELSDAKVAVLADSINMLGLMSPIVLTRNLTTGKLHLVTGRHRVGAFDKLGFDEIPAIIKEYSELDRELAEIDENLVRFDLTDMERSIQLARRKQIYSLKFPQTIENKRRAELRKKWEDEGKPKNDPKIPDFESEDAQIDRSEVKSFIEDTAEKTGRSTTQIREEVNLGQALMDELAPEVRDMLAPTNAAKNKADLKRLLDEPDADIQYEAAQMVRDSYDEWVASGEDEKARGKLVKLSDALNKLQKSPTYETTVSDNSGEETLHKTLQKNLRALEMSVGSSQFKEVAETWTYEGLDDIREDFYRIETLARRGADILTELMDAKEKLGKGASN